MSDIFTKDIEALGCKVDHDYKGDGTNAYLTASNSKGDNFWSYYFSKDDKPQSYGRTWNRGIGP